MFIEEQSCSFQLFLGRAKQSPGLCCQLRGLHRGSLLAQTLECVCTALEPAALMGKENWLSGSYSLWLSSRMGLVLLQKKLIWASCILGISAGFGCNLPARNLIMPPTGNPPNSNKWDSEACQGMKQSFSIGILPHYGSYSCSQTLWETWLFSLRFDSGI